MPQEVVGSGQIRMSLIVEMSQQKVFHHNISGLVRLWHIKHVFKTGGIFVDLFFKSSVNFLSKLMKGTPVLVFNVWMERIFWEYTWTHILISWEYYGIWSWVWIDYYKLVLISNMFQNTYPVKEPHPSLTAVLRYDFFWFLSPFAR